MSLGLNAATYVGVSLLRPPSAIERLQADAFGPGAGPRAPSFRLFRPAVTVAELRAAVARFPSARSGDPAFDDFSMAQGRGPLRDDAPAGLPELRHAEHLLASAVGAPRRGWRCRAALPAQRLAAGRAPAPRRRLGGVPVQPRPAPAGARPRAPGHHGVRPRHDPDRLEPRLRRPLRPAGRDDRPGITLEEIVRSTPAAAPTASATPTPRRARAHRRLSAGGRAAAPAPASPRRVIEIRANGLPTGGVVATYTDVTDPRRHRGGAHPPQRGAGAAGAGADRELTRLNAALTVAKAEADEPTPRRPGSWRRRATTSSSRSTPPRSTPQP